MSTSPERINSLLYFSSVLPKRSETFVYKEVLGLRRRGLAVRVASLSSPERNLGDDVLEQIAREAVTVYPPGLAKLLVDAAFYFARHPIRAVCALATALSDALSSDALKIADRPKIVVQGVAALALAWRVRDLHLSGIHIHMAHAPATVGMYTARALAIPFSFTGHAADLFRDGTLLSQKLRRAAFVACISNWHRTWYQGIVSRPDCDYPVIRCGVDVDAGIVREVDSDDLRILGLARLVPKKGFDVLIKALALLNGDGIPFECIIAGEGPERAGLEELAANLGVLHRVRFLGAVANRDVPALLSRANLMVLPCRVGSDGDRDGIPVALMEAMAAWVCVVSGDLPTIRELIEDGKSGCLVPAGDAAALHQCLRRLAFDPATRREFASAGHERVLEEFSSRENLARLESEFRSRHMI